MKIPSDQRTKQLMLRRVKLLESIYCVYIYIDVIYWRVYYWRVYIYEYDWGFEQAWRCFDLKMGYSNHK